ncbi:50S ribosome-binding GTPase [Candidatus Woesearchaeota archaeon]|nr:50S ribosome-binding GTPase [Candidatus Woesearchaeota archaeon]
MTFWSKVNQLLRRADIIVLVGDARVPEQSMNTELISKLDKAKKKYVTVFNKADLVTAKQRAEIKKLFPKALLVSATEHKNTMTLLRKLNAVAKGEEAVVGIVGYPNTGKSSIINAIKGRASAPVSSVAGYTKGLQIIRVSSKIRLIDSPGVIPFSEHDDFLLAFLSAKNPEKLKDPEGDAMQLIEALDGKVESYYGMDKDADVEQVLENIAIEIKALKKGGAPDTKRAAVDILRKWQKGKIKA